MSRLSLYLLGAPRIEVDGVPVEVSRRKAIALIAYLAVTGESHNRDSIASFLWPDYDQTRSRAALRWTLSALNKAVGKGWLEVDGERVGLKRNEALWADVEEFHKHLSECLRHGHKAEEVCSGCIKPLTEAVRLYRGDFMAGFSLQDSVSFDDWQFMETQRLRSEMALALERLVRCEGDQGELEAATGHARRWIEIDRASEKGHRQLMELYAKAGQRAAALRQYEECEKVLKKELGESPHEETRELYEAIKENRVVAEPPSVKSPPVRSNNLPRQLTSFIGREREMEEVKRLLSNTCLLTLTGSGGCGKTRLALKVAEGLVEDYKDGVWLVELASLSDPSLIPQAVAVDLEVREQPGRPLMDTLLDYLRPKQMLLVLDNCEHLIGACSTLADALLRACPNLKILAASREGLGISGEMTYRVPSLSLPDPKSLGSVEASALTMYEAARLFIDRALAVQPTFTVTKSNAPGVAQICHRLDGIPLAIELAAARVKALSVEQIATRLDDRFRLLTGGSRTALPRQQTLRATIDWSYDLLSETERALLQRLSVFAGGWALEAAEAICEDVGSYSPIHREDVLDLLTHLVNKSMVVVDEQSGEARYRLLETVRQYARDKLLESGEAATLRGRHLEWFMALAERAEPELFDADQVIWFSRLDAELDNIRAALQWSLGGGETDVGARQDMPLQFAATLWWFWRVRGYLIEGLGWLERALAMSSGASTPARAKALYGAGSLASSQGDYERSVALAQEGLAICRELGDKVGITHSLYILARHKGRYQGNYEEAVKLYEEVVVLRREIGDKRGIAHSLFTLGHFVLHQGDYERAAALCEEGLAMCRELGEKWGIAVSIGILGLVARYRGDYGQATALFKEGLVLLREVGEKYGIAWCLEGLAGVAGAQGHPERAARLFGAAEALREAIGTPIQHSDRTLYDRSVAAVRAALGEEAFKAAWAEGWRMTMEEAVAYALSTNV
jgi:non-specific serine/threonine protein kinase